MTDLEEYDRQREHIREKVGFMMRQMVESGYDPTAVAVGVTHVGSDLTHDHEIDLMRAMRDALSRDNGLDPSVFDEDVPYPTE